MIKKLIVVDIIENFLLTEEYIRLIRLYNSMDIYCFESFTLMSAFALDNNIDYDMKRHLKIIDGYGR